MSDDNINLEDVKITVNNNANPHYDIIKHIMQFIKSKKDEKERSYATDFINMSATLEIYESINPFVNQLNESKSIMNHVSEYFNKDIKTSLTTLDQAIVDDFINMNATLEIYESINPFVNQLNESKSIMNRVSEYFNKDRENNFSELDEKVVTEFINMSATLKIYESINPFVNQLNESKSIMYNVNSQLDKYSKDKLHVFNNRIINYFRETNINSIKSFKIHSERQKKLSDKMKMQTGNINRLLRREFSNTPEPRFLPIIDYKKGSKYFTDGFNNFKSNLNIPNISIYSKDNDWRKDEKYVINIIENTQ